MFNIADKALFGKPDAEMEDPEVMNSFFVDNPIFLEFRDPQTRFSVVRAKKGMGKSALLNAFSYQLSLKKEDNFVIRLFGSDISKRRPIQILDANSMINEWRFALCNEIAFNIASLIGFAVLDHEIKLVEHAELNDMKNRNFFGVIFDRIKTKTIPTQIKSEIKRPDKVLDDYMSRKDNLRVWVFIDDIDATFNNTEAEKLLITTFLSACRRIANDIKGLNIRICIRTDVWTIVKYFDESMDKVYQYIFDINWTELQIREMLSKRVISYIKRKNITVDSEGKQLNEFEALEKILHPYFDWGEGKRPSYTVLYSLAYGRPRWILELCRLAAGHAIAKNERRITHDDVNCVLSQFGKERIVDLVREHKHQCNSNSINEIINSFNNQPSLYKTDDLLKLIKNRITNLSVIHIDKLRLRANNIEIANFLYRIGFLTARENISKGKYKHYNFEDIPTLLTKGDIDRGLMWEIHPCYRQALHTTR